MTEHENFLTAERERLADVKKTLVAQRREIDTQLATIDRELGALAAYEKAKNGVSRGNSERRARRGSRREDIINVIRDAELMTRGDLLDHFGIKGDKAAEMSVSNALTALIKNNTLIRDGRSYRMAA